MTIENYAWLEKGRVEADSAHLPAGWAVGTSTSEELDLKDYYTDLKEALTVAVATADGGAILLDTEAAKALLRCLPGLIIINEFIFIDLEMGRYKVGSVIEGKVDEFDVHDSLAAALAHAESECNTHGLPLQMDQLTLNALRQHVPAAESKGLIYGWPEEICHAVVMRAGFGIGGGNGAYSGSYEVRGGTYEGIQCAGRSMAGVLKSLVQIIVEKAANDDQLSYDELALKYAVMDDGHPLYSISAWRDEVRYQNTNEGYWAWVRSQTAAFKQEQRDARTAQHKTR